ncbi:MAG: 2-iminoacetate synthase ThiH [Candidatus Omnitrophota bacterium]
MITLKELKDILDDQDPEFLEDLARRAKEVKEHYFGRAIALYAPLYLSNYCSSHCTYCGFHSHNKIKRIKLTPLQMHTEMRYVAKIGIENILLLTGESYKATPLSYLKEAVDIAKGYFSSISLEVHPMDEEEYRELYVNGVDGIAIYQETYDRQRYAQVHLSGKKKDYDYRHGAPQRIARAGIRSISLGILLGLSDTTQDLYALYEHLSSMEKDFPAVEYSVSFPRLRTIKGMGFAPCDISDALLVKIICLTRILFPRVGINLSTRENSRLRDHALEIGVTKISAASKTSVGGYTATDPEELDPQFDIQDDRSVAEVVLSLKKRGFDPVFTDWRRIENERF